MAGQLGIFNPMTIQFGAYGAYTQAVGDAGHPDCRAPLFPLKVKQEHLDKPEDASWVRNEPRLSGSPFFLLDLTGGTVGAR